MKFNSKQLAFILYNNRSVEGVVNNFIPKGLNPFKLQKLESRLQISKSKFNYDNKTVSINTNEISQYSVDVKIYPEDLEKLTDKFLENSSKFSESELLYILKRGISLNYIHNWKALGLSNFQDIKELEIIGATVHPILKNILDDQIEGGGIIFPLFENGKLVNCAIRKLGIENDGVKKTLKYTLACPDVSVWRINEVNPGDEIWITEGILDTMALSSVGLKSVSVSSAAWSSIQILKLIEKKPGQINIFSDNDSVGLRCSGILKDIFTQYGIVTKIFSSDFAKDACEHIFSKRLKMKDISEIEIEPDMISNENLDYDFIKHLKNRKF